MLNIQLIKKGINILWIGSIILGLLYSFFYPDTFSIENISNFLQKFGSWIWLIYILITFLRGIFLFPSTPFVLAGAILFPKQLLIVGLVSITGILFSATILYYFAESMGIGSYLTDKHPEKVQKVQQQLNLPRGKWLVAAWALFPFVPTDIICYVAGVVKMKYSFMIAGIFLGELLLVSFYLYLGQDFLNFL